jgi:hypothetical protein
MYNPISDYTDDIEEIDKELLESFNNGLEQTNTLSKSVSIQNWLRDYEAVNIETLKIFNVTFKETYIYYDGQFEEIYNLGYSTHPIISKITNVIDNKLNIKHSVIRSKLKTRVQVSFLHLLYQNMEIIIDDNIIIVNYNLYQTKYFANIQEFLNDSDIFSHCTPINNDIDECTPIDNHINEDLLMNDNIDECTPIDNHIDEDLLMNDNIDEDLSIDNS